MKKVLRIVLFVFLIAVLAGSFVMAKGKGKKSHRGELKKGLLIAYGSSSSHPEQFSGRIWYGYGEIEGIGKVKVRVSAAWDWYADYSSYHQGALVVTTPVDHADKKADTPFGDPANPTALWPFECDATVEITHKKKDKLVGTIIGGSVYELEIFDSIPGDPTFQGTLNEWLISFEITEGTGKFKKYNGTGVYRMTWESGPGHLGITFDDGGYVDPRRFHEQEIFLSIKK